MYLASELDSGDIIYSEETEIGEYESSGRLSVRLRDMGARLLCKTVKGIELGTAPRTPQDSAQATFAPLLTKEMSPIDWSKAPREILKKICGLDPWPAAEAELCGTLFRIFGAEYTERRTDLPAGTVLSADARKGIEVAWSCWKG